MRKRNVDFDRLISRIQEIDDAIYANLSENERLPMKLHQLNREDEPPLRTVIRLLYAVRHHHSKRREAGICDEEDNSLYRVIGLSPIGDKNADG